MEVSSHALDQHRVDGTRFAAVGFTNLTHEHLDYHGTLEQYFRAKARLFTLDFATAAAVNLDDPFGIRLRDLAAGAGLAVTTFAHHGAEADVRVEAVELEPTGSRVVLVVDGARTPVRLRLVGGFNLENAAAAAAVARAAGFPLGAIVEGLRRRAPVPGRMEWVDAGQPFGVVVDYAHTPDALGRALDAARGLAAPDARVILVFGCGGDRDAAKRPAMGRIASDAADRVVVTSDNPRSEDPAAIARAVVDGARGEVLVELDRRAAIRDALAEARHGDVVLIAGKGHETGQTVGSTTLAFDDRTIAREELEAVAWT
jgi:UDP-N-acetylmuramoyl-L-alanyl-D-glutamate--2,6-diaminopimelate ligase